MFCILINCMFILLVAIDIMSWSNNPFNSIFSLVISQRSDEILCRLRWYTTCQLDVFVGGDHLLWQ